MKKIIYTRPDGNISVVVPARRDLPEDEALALVLKNDIPPDATNVRVVDESEIPSDRTFRNAWEDFNGVKVSMPKAREIHKDKLRALRQPLLEALDIEFIRATEIGDVAKQSTIATQKQALRDVTAIPAIDEAKTPDELKAVIPEILL